MNLYGFAGGDPVNYGDPMGLCPTPDGKDDGKPCPKDDKAAKQSAPSVQFVGVQGTAIIAGGVTGAAGVFRSGSEVGPYVRVGVGVGPGDVGAGLEGGYSQSLNAFRGGSVGACGGVLGVGGCRTSNTSGNTYSGGYSVGSEELALPITAHGEATYTFAPSIDLGAAMRNAAAAIQQLQRQVYSSLTGVNP